MENLQLRTWEYLFVSDSCCLESYLAVGSVAQLMHGCYLVCSSFVCAVAAVEVEDLKMRLLLLEVKSFRSHCWFVPVTFGNTQNF